MDFKEKQIIIFDLDGTLAKSKAPMDREMSTLLSLLLHHKKVAVTSGGKYAQFQNQFLENLKCPTKVLDSLYLFPTCATSFYRYQDTWINVYEEKLTEAEKQKIKDAFSKALDEAGFVTPKQLYGELIEDRVTQISFSALGSEAPLELKEPWDPDGKKRLHIKKYLDTYIPEFETRVGGATTIDVTPKGIDKAYGIRQIEKHLGILQQAMLFVGDALFEGGNDYPVKEIGVDCIEVSGPEETKKVIRTLLY